MRFFRGVFNYRQALSLYSREHNVHRSADGNHIKINMAAQKPVGLNADYGAVDKLMLCAKGGKALEMLVHRPYTKVTAAWHGNLRFFISAEQGAQQVIGGAHSLDLFICCNGRAYSPRIDFQSGFVDSFNVCSNFLKDFCNKGDVADVRYIFNTARPSARTTAGIIATAAFFAPLTETSPDKRRPPLITYLSNTVHSQIHFSSNKRYVIFYSFVICRETFG